MSYGKPIRWLMLGKAGSGKTTLCKIKTSGLPRVAVFNPVGVRGWDAVHTQSMAEVERHLRLRYFRVAYTPPDSTDDVREAAEEFAAAVMRTGAMVAVFDEVDQVANRKTMPRTEGLLRHGRNKGISFVGTARRPAEVSRNITANLTDLWAFRFQEPRDLEYLRDFCGREFSERCANLEQYRYLRAMLEMPGNPFYEGGT